MTLYKDDDPVAASVAPDLRAALEAIRDMEPEPVDESLPDHSECAECKRIQSTPYHPSTCCSDLYRALMRRDERWERARRRQEYRMRDIARAALAAPEAGERPEDEDCGITGCVRERGHSGEHYDTEGPRDLGAVADYHDAASRRKGDLLTVCEQDCTSSCHASDCEHHGHPPAPLPSASDEGVALDVDVLARAYTRTADRIGTKRGWTLDTWAEVAAEYARLTAAEESRDG